MGRNLLKNRIKKVLLIQFKLLRSNHAVLDVGKKFSSNGASS